MKTCAACHEDLPKDKFSKKQWKLNQRRCKICIADSREVQQLPTTTANKSKTNERSNNNDVVSSLLGSMRFSSLSSSPVGSSNDYNTSITDQELFKKPPPKDECSICFIQLPILETGFKYNPCCGKVICSGCVYGNIRLGDLCPFCRAPATDFEESIKRSMKRMNSNDPEAIFNCAVACHKGEYGYAQDTKKALDLWHRAGELGKASAYYNIGCIYDRGLRVEVDKKKAKYYYELAAMRGDVDSRFYLGAFEEHTGNMERALKHFMIAARGGESDSLDAIQELFMNGHATKKDYAQALRSYQAYIDEIRSDQRDKAAAHDSNMFKYY